jgi:hypothetical protein
LGIRNKGHSAASRSCRNRQKRFLSDINRIDQEIEAATASYREALRSLVISRATISRGNTQLRILPSLNFTLRNNAPRPVTGLAFKKFFDHSFPAVSPGEERKLSLDFDRVLVPKVLSSSLPGAFEMYIDGIAGRELDVEITNVAYDGQWILTEQPAQRREELHAALQNRQCWDDLERLIALLK